jgi:hypothetical protein
MASFEGVQWSNSNAGPVSVRLMRSWTSSKARSLCDRASSARPSGEVGWGVCAEFSAASEDHP